MAEPLRIAVVFGTRPEAVKVLPVLRLLAADARFAVRTVVTGQHRQMLDEILAPFGIVPDVDLAIMQPGQSLTDIVCRTLPRLDALCVEERPDVVMVQGDTTSAFAAALAAFHRRVPVAHLEAGLRSFDRFHPYPEEANRRMVGAIADFHLAPTERAARSLAAEGVPASAITVTGNTVVDALLLALSIPSEGAAAPRSAFAKRILVTLHRREGWDGESPALGPDGKPQSALEGVLGALASVARARPDVEIVYPVHLNPRVREPVARVLGGLPNVSLREPLAYLPFVRLMASSDLVVTDSGGLQEEAPSLGIPVLVLRKTTERQEGVEAGTSLLVGTDPREVEQAIARALDAPRPALGPLPRPSPFGDGHAAERTRDALLAWFGRGPQPRPFGEPTAPATPAVPGARVY